MTNRSIPIPNPPAGGIPYSNAFKKSSSTLDQIIDIIRQSDEELVALREREKSTKNLAGSFREEIIVTASKKSESNEVDALESGSLNADNLLEKIVNHYDAGETAEAMTTINTFRREFPRHPVSIALADAGL